MGSYCSETGTSLHLVVQLGVRSASSHNEARGLVRVAFWCTGSLGARLQVHVPDHSHQACSNTGLPDLNKKLATKDQSSPSRTRGGLVSTSSVTRWWLGCSGRVDESRSWYNVGSGFQRTPRQQAPSRAVADG